MNVPGQKTRVAWQAQPGPQTLFVQCPAFEALYGGAVGGGKSDGLLGDYSRGIDLGTGWRGIFLRRYLGDLDEIIERYFRKETAVLL